MSEAVLFGGVAPDIYLKSTIASSTNDTGKFVPAVGSIVLDNEATIDGRWVIQVVKTVVTTGSTVNITYTNPVFRDENTQYDRLLDYGNDMFMVFYGKSYMPTAGLFQPGNREIRPFYIDDKLVIFSTAPRVYMLTTYDADGNRIVISHNANDPSKSYTALAASGKLSDGTYRMTFPTSVVYSDTVSTLEDGLPFYLEIYDTVPSGPNMGSPQALRSVITLTSKSAMLPNTSTGSPVTGIALTTNQDLDADTAYLFQNQPVSYLQFTLAVQKADGSSTSIALSVNNTKMTNSDGSTNAIMYGAENLVSTYVGVTIPILVKYYLPASVAADIGMLTDGMRMLSIMKYVKVIPQNTYVYKKLSMIPIWNALNSTWSTKWYGATDNGMMTIDVPSTDIVSVSPAVETTPTGTEKQVVVTVKDATSASRAFTVKYKLFNPLTALANGTALFNIWETSAPNAIYGEVSQGHLSPILYRKTSAAGTWFVFDASVYTSTTAFLNTFYYSANPPEILSTSGAGSALIPTHFILRKSSDGSVLTNQPQEVSAYGDTIDLVSGVSLATGDTVIIEFVVMVGGAINTYLYATPVMVKTVSV